MNIDNLTSYALDSIVHAYFEAVVWSSTVEVDEETVELDSIDAEIADETYDVMQNDVISFLELCDETDINVWASTLSWEQIGYDFALTRNGHGTGFWDRFYGDSNAKESAAGDRLSNWAKSMGEFTLYIGDDGLIYSA